MTFDAWQTVIRELQEDLSRRLVMIDNRRHQPFRQADVDGCRRVATVLAEVTRLWYEGPSSS